MSQPHPQSHDAYVEIIRAANVDGPGKFWPELVPELNIYLGLGGNGHGDLQFENPAGGKVTNVMTPSDVCPGAMVYHGTKDGIHKAYLTTLFLSNAQHVSFMVINASQRFKIISRTANLRLRVADTHEYAKPRDDSLTYPLESSGPLAVFLLPWANEPESVSCVYKVEKKALVLEEVNGGTNKWGCQLGHIKVAQMIGVGQHVYFGPLECV